MGKIKIVTYNLRCVYNKDGINSFIHRAVFVRDKINAEMPDAIAFQEVTPKNLEIMKLLLPEYSFVGIFRSENYDVEGLYTAVRNETFDVVGTESVWLSPTPHVAGSRFEEQSNCPRVCVETELLHKESKKRIRLFNIHLDHISEKARVLGIEAAFDFADKFYNSVPNVFLGDFNATPDSEVVSICSGKYGLCDVTNQIPVTFHDYGKTGVKIDYIYMDSRLAEKVLLSEAWMDCINGIYLSDHYPVCVSLEI